MEFRIVCWLDWLSSYACVLSVSERETLYRCPKWRELKLGSHTEATKWENWLHEFGFKTQHHH